MKAEPPSNGLCMDARMLGKPGSGVATYAAALRAAQRMIDPQALLLGDAASDSKRGRTRRWARASLPWGVSAKAIDGGLHGRDLFRLAQVWFDVHGRLLPVRVSGPAGIMHWSYPVPLRLIGWRNVYTVHDAIPLVTPQLTSIDPRRHRRLLERIAWEAARGGAIVTVSEAARAEIVSALGCSPPLVTDCSQAVAVRDDPAVALPRDLKAGRFLLVCGSVEPRKNVTTIVEAYRRSGVALPLVFAGGGDPSGALVPSGNGIVRLGRVDAAIMTALLARARALLMPSLAEGFGLPVAEAMALGTPVLTSSTGALAETADGAALPVDPTNLAAIADGIEALATDDSLCAMLAAAGLRNAERFTPECFALRLDRLYCALIAAADRPDYRHLSRWGASTGGKAEDRDRRL